MRGTGVDHFDLVVSSLDRSLPVYLELLEPLGYTTTREILGEQGERVVYLGGSGVVPFSLREARSGGAHDRYRVGIHHVAFEAPSRAAVDDRLHWAREAGLEVENEPREYEYRPGYYAGFFYDPDGIKLEILHVPESPTRDISSSVHRAEIEWERDGEDPRAHSIVLADQLLAASSAPEFGGDARRADPEELLVAALSSCHMLWFLHLARSRRLVPASYSDRPEGRMDGTRFTGVLLRPAVVWENENPSTATIAELHHEAHQACFIANSVNFPVQVEPAPDRRRQEEE